MAEIELRQQQIIQRFRDQFGYDPEAIATAPGRVNLIGEHTDYTEGFVLPIAIDKSVMIALSKSGDNLVTIYSTNLDEQIQIDPGNLQKESGWGEYIKGVAFSLKELGLVIKGWNGVVTSDIPQGAGLSSSAALEVAAAIAFEFSSGLNLDSKKIALLCRRAENEWVGVQSGIMDPMTSACGLEGNGLLIDCRTLDIKPIPLPEGVTFVVMDTMTRHTLVDSAYNERREQCFQAARMLKVPTLRDATWAEFLDKQNELDPVIAKRAMHVITENQRVLDAVNAIRRNDSIELGRLLTKSHASLRDQFEVSSDALNIMVDCALQQNECLGARMIGAGFGGSALAIIRQNSEKVFCDKVRDCYFNNTGIRAEIHACRSTGGACVTLLSDIREKN